MSIITYKLSPSSCVEQYYVHQCERFMLYQGLNREGRKVIGLEAPKGSGSEIAALAGQEWERRVATKMIESGKLIYKTKEKDAFDSFDAEETLSALREMVSSVKEKHESKYLYQGSLAVTKDFLRDYFRFDKSLYDGSDEYLQVKISRTHPDLIRASWDGEKVLLSIVDIKLAQKMKVEHKIQVALYTVLLDYLLKEYNENASAEERIEAKVEVETGYLWNYGQETESAFSIKEVDELLQEFFSVIFPGMLRKLHQALQEDGLEQMWDRLNLRVGSSCEWCENYHQCNHRLRQQGSILLLPYLSGYAQEYARKLGMPLEVEAFMEHARKPELAESLSGSRSWNYMLQDGSLLEVHKTAAPYTPEQLKKVEYRWKGVRSFSLSTWQNITLILTAQKDVATGWIYALGYYISLREKDKKEETAVRLFITEEKSENAYLSNALSFVEGLYQFLTNVDKENCDGKSRTLQGFVMDSYEKNNLEELLYDLLERKELSTEDLDKVIGLLFWLQGDRSVTDNSRQPDKAISYPLIVLSREIRKLLALPIPIAYDLRSIQRAFRVWVEEELFFHKEDRKFFGQISDALPADIIHKIWNNEEAELYGQLEKHLIKRLRNEAAILFKLQREGSGKKEGQEERLITGRLSPFRLPGTMDFTNPLLQKWGFETRYEELLQYCRIRQARQQSLEAALEKGDILLLRMKNIITGTNSKGYSETKLVFEVENGDKFNKGKVWFSGLLSSAEDAVLQEMYEFSDVEHPSLFPRLSQEGMEVLNFIEIERRGGKMYLTGKPANRYFEPETDSIFYLSERFADINTEKIFSVLHRLESGDNPQLLEPIQLAEELADTEDLPDMEKLLTYSHMDKLGFTDSQEDAFRHLAKHGLTVLQGPPGTGKTDFIARALVSLCRYYRDEKNKSLKVLISANSHSAIENALFAISEKRGETEDILIGKMDRFDSDTEKEEIKGVQLIYPSQLEDAFSFSDGEVELEEGEEAELCPLILGATNWSCAKMDNPAPFDIVVIDEASQVRVMDAMLALMKGKAGTTRYLLVGDDDQLPPIIQGKYVKEPDKAFLYGSVFRFYRDPGMLQGKAYCLMLEDNFRMNDILPRYSAEKIYSPKYKAFNRDIATRHLSYQQIEDSSLWTKVSPAVKQWGEYVLDEMQYNEENYWPLVFCRITDGNAKDLIQAERHLVTELTRMLRYVLGEGKSDEEFWLGDEAQDGIFGIISPHHEHIEKLKDCISERTGMPRETLYIGTVDKLQGQQREAVVVSYGVTDIEDAVVEGEFIYNRNRLNVSLTRAKCKTIVFFSDVLTERPVEMLSSDDEDLQKGMEYVCGFLPFMMREEEDSQVSRKDFVIETDGREVTVEVYRKRLKG